MRASIVSGSARRRAAFRYTHLNTHNYRVKCAEHVPRSHFYFFKHCTVVPFAFYFFISLRTRDRTTIPLNNTNENIKHQIRE